MLLPQHIDYLHRRGIPEQLAHDAGYRSVTEPEKLIAVGYKASQAQYVPGLLIPLFDTEGDLCGHQYRADLPRRVRGRPLKFDNPAGQRNRVTFSGPAVHALHHRDSPLLVTEGPVKSLAVWSRLGLPCATLTGVWNWLGTGPTSAGATALADWRMIDVKDRDVWIAFDADIATNRSVLRAATELSGLLSNRGARVQFLLLPPSDDKAGIDDFLAAGWGRDDCESALRPELPALGAPAARDTATAQGLPFTDRERAEAWWEAAGQFDTRRVQREDSWLFYDGKRWVEYGTKETGLNISVARYLASLSDQVGALLADPDVKDQRQLREIQRSLESSQVVTNVATWAKRMDRLYVPWGYFDNNSSIYLFNLANGTLDLRDGTFYPHRASDRLTGLSPTHFQPTAKAPDFVKFVKEILPIKEVREYVQRVLGMSLLGDPGVQGSWVFHGQGANGKGALLRIISRVLGPDYATIVPRSALQKSNREEHPTQFLEFRGRRLAWLDEFPSSTSFNEHLFKELTGGGDIKARSMRQDYVQFRPTHTLIVTTNNLPEVSSDYAMWRRLHRVPFDVEIPAAKRDEQREVRLVAEESAGIFLWLLQGFHDFWLRSAGGPGDLATPESIDYATEEWRLGQDHVAQFLSGAISKDQGSAVAMPELRKLYVTWVQEQDVPFTSQLTRNTFITELMKRGFHVKRDTRRGDLKGDLLLDYSLLSGNATVTMLDTRRSEKVSSLLDATNAF